MEDLLILDKGQTPLLRSAVSKGILRILQQASARVVLVDGADADLKAISRRAGVHSGLAHLATLNPQALAALDLTASERLFVKAWLLRKTAGDKSRTGEGLDWDAPGFAPP
ncbi:MAG: hypothetical protein ACM31L_19440 [Actinomycetota bacterium]